VKAPRSWPKSSLSISVRLIEAQSTTTKGLEARGELSCSALATEPLPVPVSPSKTTGASVGATCASSANSSRIRRL